MQKSGFEAKSFIRIQTTLKSFQSWLNCAIIGVQLYLKLVVGNSQGIDFLNGVTTDRISHVYEPNVTLKNHKNVVEPYEISRHPRKN